MIDRRVTLDCITNQLLFFLAGSKTTTSTEDSDKSLELLELEQGDKLTIAVKPESDKLAMLEGSYFTNGRKLNKNNYDVKPNDEVVECLLKFEGKESDL